MNNPIDSDVSRKFNPVDVFLYDESPRLEKNDNVTLSDNCFRYYQLNRLLIESLFIMNHCLKKKKDKIHLVFAGTVPGDHYYALAKLFPNIVRMDFWDPIMISNNWNTTMLIERPLSTSPDFPTEYKIFREQLTGERAKEEYTDKKVYFISDIRTVDADYEDQQFYKKYGTNPTKEERDEFYTTLEYRIWKEDSSLQKEIVEAMKPVECLLQLRFPEINKDLIISDGIVKYYDGYIYTPSFVGRTSRMLYIVPIKDTDGNYLYRNYDVIDIQNMIFHRNARVRNVEATMDPVTLIVTPIMQPPVWLNHITGLRIPYSDSHQIENTFDFCYMIYVLDEYLYSVGYLEDDPNLRLKAVIGQWNLIRKYLSVYTKEELVNMNDKRAQRFKKRERKQVTITTVNKPEVFTVRKVVDLRTEELERMMDSMDQYTDMDTF